METYLPEEIIEIILCHENLSISDVVNFSLTNQFYYAAIRNNNTLWKKKYFQIWPQFSKLFEKHDPDFCWYGEIKYVCDLKRKTREILGSMSLRFYKHYQLFGSHFSEWMQLYEETPRTYYYLVHDLTNIVNTRVSIDSIEVVPISTPGNKTLQYYASKVLRYLVYSHLMDDSLVRQPLKLQTLETAIVFLAQWCRPNFDVSWKDIIPKKFDELAEKVKGHLKVVHPNHPLFAVSEKDLQRWREEEIDGNKYDAENCKKVVQALESVFAFTIDPDGTIQLLPVQENYLLKELAGTDLIAVYGRYMSLLLTYQCVSRRLGLKYERSPYYSYHVVLQLSSNFSNAKVDMSYKAELPIARRERFDPIKAIYQYRLLRVNCAQCPGQRLLKLFGALSPLNISSKMFMKDCYVDYTIYFPHLLYGVIRKRIKDPRSVKPEMINILRELRGHKIIGNDSKKIRPPNLKYAVGMVMQHVMMDYKCVIYDWDTTCFAPVNWQRQNDIHLLEFKQNQPFYHTLDEHGEHEYIPQGLKECLEPSIDTASLNMVDNIGRQFSHVFETHFVPNAEKEKEYPADAAVRHMFHQKIKYGDLKS